MKKRSSLSHTAKAQITLPIFSQMSTSYPNSNYYNSCIEIQTKQELDDSQEISTDSSLIAELAEQIKAMGIIEPFSNKYQAVLNDPINILNNNLREGLQTQTSISRTRLMMYLLQEKLDSKKSKIFIPEAITPFAKWAVNNLKAELFCSEFKRQTSFTDSNFQGISLRFENLENLTYKDNFFDLEIIAFGTHLSKNHGYTVSDIENDGFKTIHKIKFLNNDDSQKGILKVLFILPLFLEI